MTQRNGALVVALLAGLFLGGIALIDTRPTAQTVSPPIGGASVPAYTRANLPPAGVAGRLARVTDGARGLWMDTGSQWHSVSGHLDPRDFGAVGDGVTDDSAALQATFDASRDGDTIILPGIYAVKTGLVLDGFPDPVGAPTLHRLAVRLIASHSQASAPTLRWIGAPGGTVLTVQAIQQLTLDGVFVDCSHRAGIGLLYQSNNLPAVFNNLFQNLTVKNCTTAGVKTGSYGRVANAQVSETVWINPFLIDSSINYWQTSSESFNHYIYGGRFGDSAYQAGGPNHGAIVTRNMLIEGGGFLGFGLNFEGVKAGLGNYDIYHRAGSQLVLSGVYSETSNTFLKSDAIRGNVVSLQGILHTGYLDGLDSGVTYAMDLGYAFDSQISIVGSLFAPGPVLIQNTAQHVDSISTYVKPPGYVVEGGTASLTSMDVNGIRLNNGSTMGRLAFGEATLDFPNTPATGRSVLTIAVSGAVPDMPVTVSVPAAVQATPGVYTAYCSGYDVITVAYTNTASTAQNPPAGKFRVLQTIFFGY